MGTRVVSCIQHPSQWHLLEGAINFSWAPNAPTAQQIITTEEAAADNQQTNKVLLYRNLHTTDSYL